MLRESIALVISCKLLTAMQVHIGIPFKGEGNKQRLSNSPQTLPLARDRARVQGQFI